MSVALILDSGPLGNITRRPGQSSHTDAFRLWVRNRIADGVLIIVPEIVDYEVRRELVRAGLTASVARLNLFLETIDYLPITTPAMRHAAELWAQARNAGWATADPKALDGDVILAAQATTLAMTVDEVIVVTENVAHLSRYVNAQQWTDVVI